MNEALTLRLMTPSEVRELLRWAADAGWEPGLDDADLFAAAEPEGFVAAEIGGQLVGGAACTSHGGELGHLGLRFVRPAYRGRGLGRRLWQVRLALLRSRLRPAAPIGLDGDLEQRDWYGRDGFHFSHRTIRYEGFGREAERDPGIVSAADVPVEQLLAYDRRCFGVPREAFVRAWLAQTGGWSLAARSGGAVRGYGTVRRCPIGARIGPLFADDAATAESLYASLAAFAPGKPVLLDIPEVNAWALSLAQRHRMHFVAAWARMYLGGPPPMDESRVYAITTLELG